MKFPVIRVYLFNYCCYEKFKSFQLNKTSKKNSENFQVNFLFFVTFF